jgi:hypothetical protein
MLLPDKPHILKAKKNEKNVKNSQIVISPSDKGAIF